jgi:hypothetical protein
MQPSAATPGATPHSTDPRDASKPWLDPDDDKVDWVMLMRCYPHARSRDDLRAAAMKAGEAAEKAAAEAKAAANVPMSEQAHDESVPAPGASPGVAPTPHH